MCSIRKAILSLLFFLIFVSTSSAQSNSHFYTIGINFGTLVYQGDLTPKFYGHIKSLEPAVSINLSRSLSPYFSLRASVVRGTISADESTYSSPEWRQYRSLRFTSSVTELSSAIVFNPLNNLTDEYDSRWSPYILAGAGLTFVNVKRDWDKFNGDYFTSRTMVALGLGIDTLNAVPKMFPVLPVGAGAGYRLSSRFQITAEATYRMTASDYVDGFKYSHNAKNQDTYYGVTLGLTYKLGSNKYKCPSVR